MRGRWSRPSGGRALEEESPLPQQEPQEFDPGNGAFWWILKRESSKMRHHLLLYIMYCRMQTSREVPIPQYFHYRVSGAYHLKPVY